MKKAWPIILVGFLLAGCSGIDTSTSSSAVDKSLSTLVPDYTEPSLVRLPNGRRFVTLGDNEDHALAVFPRPSRAFPLEDGIPGFPSDFRSKGWETSTEGFGIILHDDKIVLAMHQYEAMEADEFATLLASVQQVNNLDRFQAATINKADYWYVFSGQDELIISRIAGPKKRYQVTVTIANERVASALGILKDIKKPGKPFQVEKHAQ